MRMLLALPLVLAAGSVVAADRENSRDRTAVDHALAGKVPGQPRDCLSPTDSRSSSVHDGVVLFRVSSKLVWTNAMQGCHLLREDDILQTNPYGTPRLCRGDIAQVIDRASRFGKGACTFGDFVPYRAPG